MKRRGLLLGAVFVIGAAGWIILDADPQGREDLWNRVTGLFDGEDRPAANWGDVAAKVGEFAEEERALHERLNQVPPVELAPVPPQPVPAP